MTGVGVMVGVMGVKLRSGVAVISMVAIEMIVGVSVIVGDIVALIAASDVLVGVRFPLRVGVGVPLDRSLPATTRLGTSAGISGVGVTAMPEQLDNPTANIISHTSFFISRF